jgi:hypothetical protein
LWVETFPLREIGEAEISDADLVSDSSMPFLLLWGCLVVFDVVVMMVLGVVKAFGQGTVSRRSPRVLQLINRKVSGNRYPFF